MAINDVRLFGQLVDEPKYYKKRNAEEPYRMTLSVRTMSRYLNSSEKDKLMFDEVVVMTKSKDMISYAAKNLRKFDIVYVKGMLCTTDITRKVICGNCEQEFTETGYTCYVHPIKIIRFSSGLTDEEANIVIQDNSEVSNEVILDGSVCTDVHYLEEKKYAYYKIAVRRSFHILEDDAEKRMDYPAINVYHDQARRDSMCVHKGTRMNVRGAIRVRTVNRKIHCPDCGNEEEIEYHVLEIVASNINYTANWEAPPAEESQGEDGEIEYETGIN